MQHVNSLIRRFFSGFCLLLALSAPLGAMAESNHVAPVDINTASAETLADALEGVGLSKARSIVSYRDDHGPFKSAQELANVKGIGTSTLDKNIERIKVK